MENIKKELWLFISAFGIMFAVLSWLQESNLILLNQTSSLKGFCALLTGSVLYIAFRKKPLIYYSELFLNSRNS